MPGSLRVLSIVLPLAIGCGNVLGYDDLKFTDGGPSSTGGASQGGAPAGGAQAGGAPAGGVAAGGVAGGGAPSGGTASGGEPAGGAPNGGMAGSGAVGATGGAASGGGAGVGGSTGNPLESYRQKCVDKINEYRATKGLPPYGRWTSAESCVDGEAKTDSETGKAHSAFGSCGESAQNECPGYGSLDSTVTTCLAQMWAEGPGSDFQTHGHYINMTNTSYSEVACGFYVTPGGSVWAAQDFH